MALEGQHSARILRRRVRVAGLRGLLRQVVRYAMTVQECRDSLSFPQPQQTYHESSCAGARTESLLA
jgi:hypothetical protein